MHGTKIYSFPSFAKKSRALHIAQYVFSCEFPIENHSNIHGNALMQCTVYYCLFSIESAAKTTKKKNEPLFNFVNQKKESQTLFTYTQIQIDTRLRLTGNRT